MLWVQATVRGDANAALDFGIARANAAGVPLVAVFGINTSFPEATARAFSFLCDGIADAALSMALRGVRLVVLQRDPAAAVLSFCVAPAAKTSSPDPTATHGADSDSGLSENAPTPAAAAARAAAVPTSREPGSPSLELLPAQWRPREIVVDAAYLRVCVSWRQRVARSCGCACWQVHCDVTVPPSKLLERPACRAAAVRRAQKLRATAWQRPIASVAVLRPEVPSLGLSLAQISSWSACKQSALEGKPLASECDAMPGRASAAAAWHAGAAVEVPPQLPSLSDEMDLLNEPLHAVARSAALRQDCGSDDLRASQRMVQSQLHAVGLLGDVLDDRVSPSRWRATWEHVAASLWGAVKAVLPESARATPPVECIRGGSAQARAWFDRFLGLDATRGAELRKAARGPAAAPRLSRPATGGLDPSVLMQAGALGRYAGSRNTPHLRCTSLMSAFLHFGHIGPVELAAAATSRRGGSEHTLKWLDELLTWREMAIHIVVSRPRIYDLYEVVPGWARTSLQAHTRDRRRNIIPEAMLIMARSGDMIWDLAQAEAMVFGRTHGYLRMYWAKRLLEWTASPEEAHRLALTLNNRLFLDGRDPCSYLGVGWCFGLADSPAAKESETFGLVRPPSKTAQQRVNVPEVLAHVLAACRAARGAGLVRMVSALLHPSLGIARFSATPLLRNVTGRPGGQVRESLPAPVAKRRQRQLGIAEFATASDSRRAPKRPRDEEPAAQPDPA